MDEQFQENQEILLVNDFPLVTEISSEEYAQAIVEVLEELFQLEEPILVLFTAKDLLLQVSDALRVPHLAQYKHGEPAQLKNALKEASVSSCLGREVFGKVSIFQDILE